MPRGAQQRIELHVRVAERAGNRRAPAAVVLNERPNHAFFKLFLEIDDVVGEAQVLRHSPRVIDVVNRAATVLLRLRPGQLRQAALVPELHR